MNDEEKTSAETERKSLLVRAGIVGLGTLFSRILGLVRDIALAAVFRRGETDAFFVAFTIPNALRQILGEGAVSGAVVPVLMEKMTKEGHESGRSFFARVRGLSLLVLFGVSLVGVYFAEPLTDLFAHGSHAVPGQFERTVSMTRVVFPYIFFMGSAALGMAALNVNRRFAAAAFTPALLNVALIAGAFGLPSLVTYLGYERSLALAWAALLGGLLQVLAQWPSLRAIGYAALPKLDLRDPSVREVLRRLLPLSLGIGVYYIDLVLSRRFLSDLGEGAQSYFTFASRLCDFPQGIFVMALSTAALPTLSLHVARQEQKELEKTFVHGLGLALFVAIPASVAIVILAEPIVEAIFHRGAFDTQSVHETARALRWQGSAIWTVAVTRQLVALFHARGNTRTPVYVSIIDLIAFIALALWLRGPMKHAGISAAVAGSSAVQMVLLVVAITLALGFSWLKALLPSFFQTTLSAVLSGAAVWFAYRSIHGHPIVVASVCGSLYVAAFAFSAWALGSKEFQELGGTVRRRLLRKRQG